MLSRRETMVFNNRVFEKFDRSFGCGQRINIISAEQRQGSHKLGRIAVRKLER